MNPVFALNCTLYVSSSFGYRHIECRHLSARKRPLTQAVECVYENTEGIEHRMVVDRLPRMVVLAGHGHPDVPCGLPDNHGDSVHHTLRVPEHDDPFSTFFEAYKAEKHPVILADIKSSD